MKRISVRAHANAPAEVVYELLRDGTTWPEWSPFDAFEVVAHGDAQRLGEVHEFHVGRQTTRERVAELVPGRRYAYELVAGLPLRDYRADVDLAPDDTGTLIHWHASFRPGRPGTGWIYRAYLTRFIGRCARGLAGRAAAIAGDGGRPRSAHEPG